MASSRELGLKAQSILLQNGITEEKLREEIIDNFGSLKHALRHVLQQNTEDGHAALKMLLKLGVSPTEKFYTEILFVCQVFHGDSSPLKIAYFCRNEEAVRILCEHGADPRKVIIHRMPLLHGILYDTCVEFWPRDKYTAKVVSILLEYGADPNEICEEFGTALRIATARYLWIEQSV